MDKKFIIFIIILTLGIIGLAIFVSGFSSTTTTKATVSKTAGAKISVDHSSKKVGNIPYGGGNLIHVFPIKNAGTKDLEIANIATSCMCTKAYLKQGDNKSEGFGMKGMSASSSWKGIIKPEETAEIIVDFDPTYHGPQGIGSITRMVSFETNDPDNPYVEVSFEGEVVK